MSNISTLSVEQLKRAIAIREQIESLQNELNNLGSGRTVVAQAAAPGRRKMSAAARARIAAAARARWARVKGKKVATPAAKPAAKKSKMSPAARAKIAAAQKARWAKLKAQKGGA